MPGDYDGLVAVVTGGASGIGAATAQELLSRGARVAAFDLDPSACPDEILGMTVDVSDDASAAGVPDDSATDGEGGPVAEERPAQVAVPTAGGDTEVVTETPSPDPTDLTITESSTDTAGGPGEEPTSTQSEAADEKGQAEG